MTEENIQLRVSAANARTHYYKKKAKQLKQQVTELQQLLDEKTTPDTNIINDATQLVLTKVPIAFRRTKLNGAFIPVEEELYVVEETTK